jgi:phosphate uptake regulator
MYTVEQVVNKLREASARIQKLSDDNEALLQKVASLEAELNASSAQIDENGIEVTPSALQKQAAMEFTPRGNSGFGSAADDLPLIDSDLTPEQRLDLILTGESPHDYDN